MDAIAIFASGAGSNAKNIIEYFRNHLAIRVSLIVCNKPGAGVLTIAEDAKIPVLMIEKDRFFKGDSYLQELKERNIDFIILAGFLWKLPSQLVSAFRGRIINIHPALLPKYGGKGMYGTHVHEAVIAAGDKISGISIHHVDDLYDHGHVIFQASCLVDPSESPESLAKKIHALEHAHYPRIIEQFISSQKLVK